VHRSKPPGERLSSSTASAKEGQQKDFSRPEVEARFNEQSEAKASAEGLPVGRREAFSDAGDGERAAHKRENTPREAMLMAQILNRTFVLSKVGIAHQL